MKSFVSTLSLLFLANFAFAQCTASFTWDDTDITIQFMDTSTSDPGDPIVSWFWDFDDDGNTSTQQNPTYTFSDADKYDVVLTITTQNGCTSSIEIEIETCVLNVSHTIGVCDASGNIPVDITINDPWDVAEEVDVILDGQSVPGSPFNISAGNPVNISVDVPGDGLDHVIQCQSIEIATCGKIIEFTVEDCSSDCFLSGLQIGYPAGITHTVDVGDDFFSPVSVGIVLGDIVNFDWVGDGHSTTSDVTSGPDAWNSGVISIGSSFDVVIENPGTHPYYCIPHGSTGGVGMSGEILANCPTGNSLDLVVSFNTTIADAEGYNIYYDGAIVPGSPFSYAGTGGQSQTISIAGDGLVHPLVVEDVNDPTCTLSMDYNSPDCDQGGGNPVCSISVSLGQPSGCDANQEVMVDATIIVANGGTGFNLAIDGGAPTFYTYNGPSTTVTLNLPGDGLSHTIAVTDEIDGACTANDQITTPDCNLPCSITNLILSEAGATGGITHTVSVEDNIFNPSVVNITTGDLVEWFWNGAIAHTSTSDATSGPDSWDSGLLNQGATYTSPVLSEGEHPYYCVPHGNPGGVGMAGTIFVLPPCNAAGEVIVNVDFDVTSNGTSGYEVLVDGIVAGTFTYQGGSAQSASVNVIGDAMSHTIQVRDIDDNACTASADITTGDCDGGGTAMCSISATSSLGGGCDGNNQVPVDIVVTASDQGANFSVTVDGVSQGTFPYTGGTTNITINVDGDGQDHTIVLTDDVDAGCTTTTVINTPNCTLPCSITNLMLEEAGATGGITHTVSVEDNIFNPSVVNITTGDLVEWVWNGAIAHTSTSDATSGPDSWDSGLLNQGATYTSPVLSEGEHPYYCVPHGNPGGVGMAGTIFVLPPCNAAGEVVINVNFDVTSSGASGYEVLVDGVVAGTFTYQGGSAQSASVNVIGDAMSHTIQVRDIDDNACTASADITTGDCDGGGTAMCSISATSSLGGGCDGNNQVPVDLVVTASDQGANFSVTVDGVSQGTFPYTGGTTNIIINVDGDGQDHTIVLTDDVDAGCTTTTVVNTPNCTLPCSISNLMVEEGGATGGTTHTVGVEDFIFNPSVINITTGDVIEWVWTGDIPHTATSDVSSGPDSWDSGLLNTGDTYTSPVLSEGEHPYYCIPHGSTGGVGMAGTIFVLPPCNAAGEVDVNVNFDVTSSGASGYEILVDGVVAGTFSYVGGSAQSATVNVIGDAMSHTIQVRDIDDNACTASADITTGDCDGGGTAMCSISATSTVAGGCDGNNQVPVDLVVNASDQGANFSVSVDGVSQGTFPYTGSTTNITINVDGDGQDHSIVLLDDGVVDSSCSTTTIVTTPDCTSGCEINDISLVFGENTTHIIKVEDFDFIPDSINIILGDTILFDWTGNIPHTATSDSQNGPNSFDSDLLSQGATYELILTAVGDHPYYCVPHGAPGGIGMAGNISVSPSCDGEDALATISVSSNGSSGQGFALLLDGDVMPESPLSFDPSGVTTGSITVPGNSMSHVLVVADVDNPSCIDSITFIAPLCEIDSCSTMISDVLFSDCNGANVSMTVEFNSLIGLEDHNVYFNGNLLNNTPITTNDQGLGTYSTSVAGLGEEVEIVVTNILTPTCSDTLSVVTPDCNVPCLMSDVSVGSDAGIHIVEVRDFDFFPQDIEILIGDTVRFLWTGVIPHTATSDATTGEDVWDSGLFGEGHVFDVVINTLGDHPYYCTPHGGPGGIGMAGDITAIDTCDGDQWLTNYEFTVSAGSPLGYNIFIDSDQWNTSPIQYDNPVGINSGVVSLPGDEMTHLVTFQDLETDFCAFTTSVTTGACGAGCTIENLTANVGAGVIHEVEVRDFDFLPLEVTVRAGETVRFIWTGDIPHTSTSDMLGGSDSWDSGLLSNGDTFDIIINTPGEHPYYCIPHGGPGGIGQSGIINVLPQCQDGTQEVNIRFDANGGSAEGYKLFVDGSLIGGLNAYNDPQGQNEISVLLPADGLEHIVTIQDDDNPICAASAFYQSEDCATDCEIAGLMYDLVANKHTVEVRDFDYLPLDIVVEVGDTILFDWTGEIPHTVTSDATTGASQFNSGLLQEGDQWILIFEEVGEHPYYCIPHGGPGGIGMAGNITVVDPCDDGEVTGRFTFTTSRLSGSFDVLLNGNVEISGVSYSGMPENTFILQLAADNSELTIEIIDQSDSNCNTSITIPGINCNDPCFDVVADYTYDIDFATMEVDFTDISNGNIVSWSWDFGDGSSSTEANPSHTYADPIVYDVCLTIGDDQDCESTFCDKVRFSDQVCIAGFTYEQNDLEFTFVNTSDYADPATDILWTFGDGDISMAADSVDHIYDLGVYTVCIQISSDSCVANYCEMIDLSDPCLALRPDFSVTKDGESLTVEFSDLTSGTPDSWLWGFGDGNTSTEQNPSHTFDALGEYNICLFVQEETNSCSKTICKKIAVGTTNVTEIEYYKPLNIFPNPSLSLGEIYIEGFEFSDVGKEAQIEVSNSSGQLVHSMTEMLRTKHSISIEGAPGVYFISIETNDNLYRAMGVRQ